LLGDSVDGRALLFVSKLPLVGLDIDRTNMSDADVDTICRFQLLETLGIANTKITEKGIAKLSSLPNLIDLQIGGPLLDDKTLSVVSKLEKLHSINLRDTEKVTAAGVTKLAAIPGLESLTLRNLKVGPELIGAVSEIKQLRQLYVDENKFPERAFQSLKQSGLNELKLRRSVLTDEHLEEIGELKSLRFLDLEQSIGFTQEGLSTFRKKHPQCEITLL